VHLSYQHKSIIVGGCIRSCFQTIGTSTYASNYIICFKCFLIIGVRYISYGDFQTKFNKLVAVIVYARLKKRSWFIPKTQLVQYHWGLGMFYMEMVGSQFHQCKCGNHHNCADIDALVAGFADIDIDSST